MSRKIQCRAVRCGSALVLLIVLLPVVLAVCAYVINVVYMELARTELQISTDVATRAAGRTLAVTGSEFQARLAADRMLKLNSFVNQSLTPATPKSLLARRRVRPKRNVIRSSRTVVPMPSAFLLEARSKCPCCFLPWACPSTFVRSKQP